MGAQMQTILDDATESFREKIHITSDERLVTETSYDAAPALERAEMIRQLGGSEIGSKGQQLIHVACVNEGDIVRLKNLGYNLLSSDPAESHRALLYLRDNNADFVTRKDAIADRKAIWR
jgi:hypothetical protein